MRLHFRTYSAVHLRKAGLPSRRLFAFLVLIRRLRFVVARFGQTVWYEDRPNYVSIEIDQIVLAAQPTLYNLRHLFDVAQLFSIIPDPDLAQVNMRLVSGWPSERIRFLVIDAPATRQTLVDPPPLKRPDVGRGYTFFCGHTV